MRSFLRQHGVIVLVLAVLLVGAGCGGDDDDSASSDAAGSTAEGTSKTTEAPADDGASSSNSGDLPTLGDASYAKGTAHFEVSGDKDASYDLLGGGATTGGFTTLSFRDDGTGATLAIVWGDSESDPAVALAGEDFATGGTIGKECSVSVDTSDATSVAGEFECKDMPGVGGVQELKLDAKGSFELGG
jgi:hypothetical protein